MDNPEEVAAYAKADFSDSNQWYVDRLIAEFPQHLKNVIDIGCGPADIAVRLGKARRDVRITAVDGSGEMLKHGRRAVEAAGIEEQVRLFEGYVPGLNLEEHSFDAVLSKDFLHHLPDPMALWKEARRLGKPGAAVFVMDLIRPDSREDAMAIVERVAGNEPPVLKNDFFISLCAAFTVEEAKGQIAKAGLGLSVSQATERHLLIKGSL